MMLAAQGRDKEDVMRLHIRVSVGAFALVALTGLAAAQSPPDTTSNATQSPAHLTQAQKQAVMDGLKNEQAQASPQGEQPQVGSKTPGSTTPHAMPNEVASQVPDAKTLLFVKLPDRVLLIDPETKTVAEMILDTDTKSGVSGSTNPASGGSR
jgi:hypothetical protein